MATPPPGRHYWRLLKAMVVVGPPVVLFKDRWMWVYRVEGQSMAPTLNPNERVYDSLLRDWVLIKRETKFERNDIVLLRDPVNNRSIVKRITEMENDGVIVDAASFAHARVPIGHCWVEGDNARKSVDSRHFGPVPQALLDGQVLSVVWPWWRARWLVDEEGKTISRRPRENILIPPMIDFH
eukprot:CAMPEP_0178396818 /NCGR_PEP_ID=MMETSP0689_2-20121128/13922_1 /TAXON_ID=160604 /ORGANISM="Amphidinium massartii, Strain CS-259" /LENGTH=181 /DNA_ID=CAMNT_0020017499 /DNA_START=16 /DNA_END=558 /DNA_ORIENTATION=-